MSTSWLDDIHAVGDRPERSGAVCTGIEVHQGKTQLWNRAGVAPASSATLTAATRVADPSAIVWRGDPHLPPEEPHWAIPVVGNFKDVRFHTMFNFGHVWAALLKIRVLFGHPS